MLDVVWGGDGGVLLLLFGDGVGGVLEGRDGMNIVN